MHVLAYSPLRFRLIEISMEASTGLLAGFVRKAVRSCVDYEIWLSSSVMVLSCEVTFSTEDGFISFFIWICVICLICRICRLFSNWCLLLWDLWFESGCLVYSLIKCWVIEWIVFAMFYLNWSLLFTAADGILPQEQEDVWWCYNRLCFIWVDGISPSHSALPFDYCCVLCTVSMV